MQQPAPRNRLAFVALAASLAGFLCLPLVGSIVGIVCGVIARRRPVHRSVAVAAIALGAVAPLAYWPVVLFVAARVRGFVQYERTLGGGYEILGRACEFRGDNGRWPVDAVECFGAEIPPFDAWGTPLALRVEGEDGSAELFVWSAGRDRAWDTGDDWVVSAIPVDAAKKRGLREKP